MSNPSRLETQQKKIESIKTRRDLADRELKAAYAELTQISRAVNADKLRAGIGSTVRKIAGDVAPPPGHPKLFDRGQLVSVRRTLATVRFGEEEWDIPIDWLEIDGGSP